MSANQVNLEEMAKVTGAFIALVILFVLLAIQFAYPVSMPIIPLLYVAFLAFVLWRFVLPGEIGLSVDRAKIARGETVRVQMEIPGGARRVEIGIRAEEVYERTGKHSIMRKETIHEESRPLPTGSQGKQSASFEIPKGAPPSIGSYGGSFGSESVRLRWYIFADADMPNASDIHSKLDLTVE